MSAVGHKRLSTIMRDASAPGCRPDVDSAIADIEPRSAVLWFRAPYVGGMAQGAYEEPSHGSVEPPKVRTCLNCREPFDSFWAGERICKVCKSREAWRTSGSDMSV